MLNCGMVRLQTGHHWHCSWPVKEASLGMCPCKWWTFWTPFMNKLLQTICIFMHFWFKWLLSIVSAFYCVDAWWSIGLPFLTAKALGLLRTVNTDSEWTTSKTLIYCMVLIFALISTTFGISFICWIDDKKVTFKTCFTCMRIAIFWFLRFPR